MPTILITPALTAAIWCLYVRKGTLWSYWDRPATIAVLLLTVDVVMMTPPIGLRLGPYLYNVCGAWNVEELLGHNCYLAALLGFNAMAVRRLKMTERRKKRWVQINTEILTLFYIPVATAFFFWGGGGDRNVADLVLEKPRLAMYPYWLLTGAMSLYLTGVLAFVLWEVRKHPASNMAAKMYLAACGLSVLGVVFGVIILLRGPPMLLWLNIRLELLVFAVAAGTSGAGRMRVFKIRRVSPIQPAQS